MKGLLDIMKSQGLRFGLAADEDKTEILKLYWGMIGAEGCTWSEE